MYYIFLFCDQRHTTLFSNMLKNHVQAVLYLAVTWLRRQSFVRYGAYIISTLISDC